MGRGTCRLWLPSWGGNENSFFLWVVEYITFLFRPRPLVSRMFSVKMLALVLCAAFAYAAPLPHIVHIMVDE